MTARYAALGDSLTSGIGDPVDGGRRGWAALLGAGLAGGDAPGGTVFRPLARRQHALNTVVHALSTRYDTVHLHMSETAWIAERALWSADRLHPGERGHRMIAARFHELLAARGLAQGAAPSLDAEHPPPGRARSLYWLATEGTASVARRCRDLLPELLRLGADEIRHRGRGTTARLDALADQALVRALAALTPRPLPTAAADSGGTAPAEASARAAMGLTAAG